MFTLPSSKKTPCVPTQGDERDYLSHADVIVLPPSQRAEVALPTDNISFNTRNERCFKELNALAFSVNPPVV